MWREHAGLSVTDGSQQRAMMESLYSAFMFRARPDGTLGASEYVNFVWDVSNIDQRAAAVQRMLGSITAQPSAAIGDRETGCSRPTQGDSVTSSQQFLTAIERPRCSRCQARMMLEHVSAGPIGFEHRLFECPRCDHVETTVIASDPFKSNATGWLVGELRAPN